MHTVHDDVLPEIASADSEPPIGSRTVVKPLPLEAVSRLPGRARYEIGEQIGAGGMATVHLGRLVRSGGVSLTVAIKRLHPELAHTSDLRARFVDEARIASRIRHANVVQTLDVVESKSGLLLVLEYVHGESFAVLRRAAAAHRETVPPAVAVAIVVGTLRGLHAAHESTTEAPLGSENDTATSRNGLVHRDVSPQNVLVGTDGIARVLDFGIAQAEGCMSPSAAGGVRGKLAYMAPEQLNGDPIDRRCDLFSAAVMLWEALAGERLFRGDDAMSTAAAILHREAPRLAGLVPDYPSALDDVLSRALAKRPDDRFATADQMADALTSALRPADERDVAAWVERMASDSLAERERGVAAFEQARPEAATLESVTRIDVGSPDSSSRFGALPPLAARPPAAVETQPDGGVYSLSRQAAARETCSLPTPWAMTMAFVPEAPSSSATSLPPPTPSVSRSWVAALLVVPPLLAALASLAVGSPPRALAHAPLTAVALPTDARPEAALSAVPPAAPPATPMTSASVAKKRPAHPPLPAARTTRR